MVYFQRAPRSIAGGLAPGQWRPLRDGTMWSASVACPTCGSMGTLLDHEIDADGTVRPSLVCPGDAGNRCSFHDNGRLVGWPP